MSTLRERARAKPGGSPPDRPVCAVTPLSTTALPASAGARVRAVVRTQLCPEHGQDAEAAAMLLAGELVSQAVSGGVGAVTLTLECQVSQIRIAVDHPLPARATPAPPSSVSRLLVEKVSRQCGREVGGTDVTLWCTLPTGVLPAPRWATVRGRVSPPTPS